MKKRKFMFRCFCIMLICMISLSAVAFGKAEPTVTAQTAILMESSTQRILFDKDMHKKMFPASMTKIMTALVALDYFKPDDYVTVGQEINTVTLDSSKAGHQLGETIQVVNLLRGLLIPSGNDSATVIAAAVAKKVTGNPDLPYEECEKEFAKLMNEKAKELGALDTQFTNPHGYHNEDHYTSAYDVALFSLAAMKNETIHGIARETGFDGNGAGELTKEYPEIKSQTYHWKSHNLLITGGQYAYPYATGLKTGFTDEAGDCIAATAEKDGTQLILVIFNSEDPNRWTDAATLFQYGFEEYHIQRLQTIEQPVGEVSLETHNRVEGDTLALAVQQEVSAYISPEEEENIKISISYEKQFLSKNKDSAGNAVLTAPIQKGDKIGVANFQLNGQTLVRADVFAARDVGKRGIGNTIHFYWNSLWANVLTVKGGVITGGIVLLLFIGITVAVKINKSRKKTKYTFRKNLGKRRF